MIARTLFAALLALAAPGVPQAVAGPVSLLGDGAFGARAALIPAAAVAVPEASGTGTGTGMGTAPRGAAIGNGALFGPRGSAAPDDPPRGMLAGRDARGAFFAPDGPLWGLPGAPMQAAPGPARTGAVAKLRDLIARAEAGRDGYDAVQHGARIKPPKAPTAMTLAEIEAWTVATPRQPHAIGRYQFIPATLRRLVAAQGLAPGTRFSPQVQDLLADRLLAEAGMADFLAGALPRERFMHNLARIWAGLPLANGRSYYDGHAGNKATMSWQDFESTMLAIFPQTGG